MANFTYANPVINQPNSTEDAKIITALTQIFGFGNKFAWGVSSMVFPFSAGSRYSQFLTINHGLPTTPTAIFVSLQNGDATANVVGTPNATSFQALGNAITFSTITATNPISWLAIA